MCDKTVFEAKWITAKEFKELEPIDVFHKESDEKCVPESPIKNCHIHFRRSFCIDNKSNVKIRISADDYYKLYINGEFVCQGPAPSYCSSYNYNEADISDYLTVGENVIAVHVYYQGLINRVWNSGDNRIGMIADIISDGEPLFGTDSSWKYSIAKEYSGEIYGYQTAFTENINFNLEEKNWTQLGFDDGAYKPAAEKPDDDHIFAPQPTDTVEVYTIKPDEVTKIGAGEYFIDFGREITGQFKMTVKGRKNQRVLIVCGEECEQDNPLSVRKMRCGCNYADECILSGETDTMNFYDYKAFRYVNVRTDTDNLIPESFCAVVRHHKFEEKCRLETNVKYLKEIWDICCNALRCGVQEGFLDCPSREKGQYLGDFTVSGLAYVYITGDWKMYRKTLFDFAQSAKICDGLMCVAPGSFMQEIADFSLQYPLQVMNYYNYTRDRKTLTALFQIVCCVIDYFSRYERDDGLLENCGEKWNMVDWPMNLRDNYSVQHNQGERTVPVHNVINAYYIGARDAADKIAEIAGAATRYGSERQRRAYTAAFYDSAAGLFCDDESKSHASLHSNVLATFFGIATPESYDSIRSLIMGKGLECGVQFAFFVLKALAKMGAYADEMSLILSEGEHSWVNMLREGATACFEAWGKEQKWNTSLCHPWACAPIIAIIEDILKIPPEQFACGEKTVVLKVDKAHLQTEK